MNIKNRAISLMITALVVVSTLPATSIGVNSEGEDPVPEIPVAEEVYKLFDVLATEPSEKDWSYDKEKLYKSFPNRESGNYITVIFNSRYKSLKRDESIDASSFEFYSSDEPSENLIDKEKKLLYEGFSDSKELLKYKAEVSGEIREDISSPYGTAKLYIDDDKYKVGDDIKITLYDHDLNSDQYSNEEATVSVTIGDVDSKEVTLIETERNSGKFEGKIKVWEISEKEEGTNLIEVKYVKRQSGDGTENKEIKQSAELVNRNEYRKEAQIYIEKDLYIKNEGIKITVVDKSRNRWSSIREYVEVILSFPDDSDKAEKSFTLIETGVNTGIFETIELLEDYVGKFNITYTSEEKYDDYGKAKVYIPITDDIQDDTIYKVKLPQGFVHYETAYSGKWKNRSYEWSFKTSKTPLEPNADINFKGSAPQDYDRNHKMILKGENFSDNVRVYFRDISGEEYRAIVSEITSTSESDDKLLHVYLPTGRNRLDTGIYDILIENEGATPQEINYGVYSIVPRGGYVSNEEHRVKDAVIGKEKNKDTIEGGLKEIIRTSKNELELSSKYTNKTLYLDSILGQEVLIREIKYDGSSISILNTKSKWADIKLIGLKRDSSSQPMTIRLGRAEPVVRDSIKKKLTGDSIKSECIQISGTNYELGSAELSIPYKESNGDNLKILRYDEDTRRIDKNISFRVNKIDKKIEITNAKKGIFVVVE